MSSTFALKCPKCGNIVRKSLRGLDIFNPNKDNFCFYCGLSVDFFHSFHVSTVGTGDYYYDA